MPRYIDANKIVYAYLPIPAIGDIYVTKSKIDEIPTADVRELVHGKLIKTGRRYPYCSVCDTSLERSYFKFCPYCGAVLDEGEE